MPLVTLVVTYQQRQLAIEDALIDTGSATTIVDADRLATIGITARDGTRVRKMHGIGGVELSFVCVMGRVAIGDRGIESFPVDVGALDYGRFELGAIVGMDFLRPTGAIIDLARLELRFS